MYSPHLLCSSLHKRERKKHSQLEAPVETTAFTITIIIIINFLHLVVVVVVVNNYAPCFESSLRMQTRSGAEVAGACWYAILTRFHLLYRDHAPFHTLAHKHVTRMQIATAPTRPPYDYHPTHTHSWKRFYLDLLQHARIPMRACVCVCARIRVSFLRTRPSR